MKPQMIIMVMIRIPLFPRERFLLVAGCLGFALPPYDILSLEEVEGVMIDGCGWRS